MESDLSSVLGLYGVQFNQTEAIKISINVANSEKGGHQVPPPERILFSLQVSLHFRLFRISYITLLHQKVQVCQFNNSDHCDCEQALNQWRHLANAFAT